jgi:hypothetical protein
LGENLQDEGGWLLGRCWSQPEVDDTRRRGDSFVKYQVAIVAIKGEDESILTYRALNHRRVECGGINLRDRYDIMSCGAEQDNAWQREVLVCEQAH